MNLSNKVNDVKPFRAMHFNPGTIDDIGLCLSQPYDVINPEQLEQYLGQHENNIVRLTLPKITDADDDTRNRYTRSRDTLGSWRKSDVISLTGSPSFWVYEQEFKLRSGEVKKIKGFIGLVRLQDFESMKILPHEKVLKKPVEDRIRLTRETNTQFEYIWGVYKDKDSVIDEVLDKTASAQPIIDFDEKDKSVRHRFWRLADKAMCGTISRVMAERKIYIADGHHRYQTMLNIRDEKRSSARTANPDAPYEYIMMYLTNSEHEGLTILPTHRMLHDLAARGWDKAMKTIGKYFDVEKFDFDRNTDTGTRAKWLAAIDRGIDSDKRFGLYLKGRSVYYVLTLKNKAGYEAIVPSGNSNDWKMLDVNIVNFLLLKEVFGISEEELSLGEKIKYVIDPDEAIEKVNTTDMDAAVILNSTKLADVLAIADNKESMPRKSTFFYPKPLSGLVMYSMDENDA
jgi:uncharacterized protein (DUF1015 family)